ncbi:Transcriptional regulator, TetR family [Streptomyces sp. YIM 130001]|uniref:TetR/AcrR family transcriptional regulator n=1 Tax=Streptomyces sp. YIM 130001 TaxID=2259644 RepID=UPI000E6488E3|nr:TetR/AcrR family transcriptional regulator [Streptomyces sp. YIM 130001]RII13534.1 Transcriptional regulator, TetR family [Streptomyces sp. YIM 130001]
MADASEGARRGRPRGGSGEKRQAVMRGARVVFGREGYTRAGIDAIAAEAGVSSRTLYNHFGGKESLFRAVLLESAEAVTAATRALFDRHFHKFREPYEDLLDLGLDWARQREVHAEHFALVRQIIPEGPRLPADVLAEWQSIGPDSTQLALQAYLLEAGQQGRLAVDESNAARATRHLSLFLGGAVMIDSYYGALPLQAAEVEELVRDGVETFLRLYGVE